MILAIMALVLKELVLKTLVVIKILATITTLGSYNDTM